MRRFTCATVARAVGNRFRRGASVRELVTPAYTTQQQHALEDSEADDEQPDAVYHTEETQQLPAEDDEPDAVYLADEMTPSLAKLVAGTTMAVPQTRHMRTNLELLRRHNSRCSNRTAPLVLPGRLRFTVPGVTVIIERGRVAKASNRH